MNTYVVLPIFQLEDGQLRQALPSRGRSQEARGSMGVALVLAIVAGLLLFYVLLWCVKSKYERREALEALREPLLVPTQYRLDAAVREAEEGFNACPVCGFENFKRVSFCIVCGTEVRTEEPSVEPQPKRPVKYTKHTWSLLPWRKHKDSGDAVEIVTIASPKPHVAAQRERRARKRKEWTRQMDAQGRLVWHHNAQDNASDGYVVHFQVPVQDQELELVVVSEPEAEESSQAQDADEQVQDEQAPADQQSREKESFIVPSRRELAEQVRETSKEVSMLVENACDGDAAGFPIDKTLANAAEAIQSASSAFPTKYADFVVKAMALLVPPEEQRLTFHVTRANVWEESIETLSAIPLQSVRWTMRIDFVNEVGIDAGGLTREWFVLVNEAMADPTNGVFTCVNKSDQSYYLNRHSAKQIGPDHLLYFLGAGRLIGRALLEGSALGFHLSLPLLKIILGLPITFEDLEFYDPELYRSLLWVQENDNVEELGLDFSVTEQIGDQVVVVDLIPNGRYIDVNDDNKFEFLERKFHYLLFESVSSQLYMFLKGIYEVLPQELLMPFDVEEFDYLLCGSDEIDVDDWQRNTVDIFYDLVEHPDHPDWHPARGWFWELVREMPNKYRRRLLQFATGSSRVPLAGFSALTSYDGKLCPFTLKGVQLVGDGFITSHACFNRLDLPMHCVRDELKTVLYAILDTEVYGFTMD